MHKLLSDSAVRITAAFVLPSNSTGRLSHSPFNDRDGISRAQAGSLRPGDQIAAPWRPTTDSAHLTAVDLVGKPSGGSLNPFWEEDQ